MNVSIAVQVISSSTRNVIQTEISDDNTIQNIRLDFYRHNYALNLMSKANFLAHMCDGTFSGSNNFTKFAPECATEVIEEHLHMLVWFNFWKVGVFSKDENKKNEFLPIQTWRSMKSLMIGMAGYM